MKYISINNFTVVPSWYRRKNVSTMEEFSFKRYLTQKISILRYTLGHFLYLFLVIRCSQRWPYILETFSAFIGAKWDLVYISNSPMQNVGASVHVYCFMLHGECIHSTVKIQVQSGLWSPASFWFAHVCASTYIVFMFTTRELMESSSVWKLVKVIITFPLMAASTCRNMTGKGKQNLSKIARFRVIWGCNFVPNILRYISEYLMITLTDCKHCISLMIKLVPFQSTCRNEVHSA